MSLKNQTCVPCEGGMPPMSDEGIKKNLAQIQGWDHVDIYIKKNFEYKDFKAAMAFANAVALIAETEGHHPDIRIHSYKNVEITLSTHAVGGLSVNDFILAAKIDSIELPK